MTTVKYTWNDWRPIGMWWPCRSGEATTDANPDGLFAVHDLSDKRKVIRWGLRETEGVIKRLQAINAQGVYFHGMSMRFLPKMYSQLKRVEYQNPDNRSLGFDYFVSEEGTTLLERMMRMITDAGLWGGCLIRPSYPRGLFTGDISLDGKYLGQVPIDRDRVFGYIEPRVKWAYDLGMRFFYIDSPGSEKYGREFLEQLSETYRDCLFMPEVTPNGHAIDHANTRWKYEFGVPWAMKLMPERFQSVGWHSALSLGQSIYPRKEWKDWVKTAIKQKCIVIPRVWYNSPDYKVVLEAME